MIAPVIAALLAAAASPSPYPGFETLPGAADAEVLCTSDEVICVESLDHSVMTVAHDGEEIGRWSPDTEGDDLSFAPMPALIRLGDGRLLVGALASRQTSYSGGGGSATQQVLLLVEPGKAMRPVLTLPESGALMLRACFSERDLKQRAGACHAEFRFAGTLSAGTPSGAQLPPLSFRMEASHFPRGASRYDDTTSRLHKADLKWEEDARCTFERGFHFDAALGEYRPDAELPDCTDYTEP